MDLTYFMLETACTVLFIIRLYFIGIPKIHMPSISICIDNVTKNLHVHGGKCLYTCWCDKKTYFIRKKTGFRIVNVSTITQQSLKYSNNLNMNMYIVSY